MSTSTPASGVLSPAQMEWVAELPADTTGRVGRHRAIAAALRQRPGTWALIATYPSRKSAHPLASDIRGGKRRPAYTPTGAYEAQVRTVDGAHRVYARYLGTPGATHG